MSFPKLAVVTHLLKQESTGKEIKFRPYLVREEKILMQAKESAQVKDIFLAIQAVVGACCLDKHINVEKLPLFDLESFFLRLRAISVNNIETIVITDEEDEKQHFSRIDFNDVKVIFPEPRPESIIKVGPIAIQMKYPSAAIYDETNEEIMKKIKAGHIFDLLVSCIDKIFNGDVLLKYSQEELLEFLNGLDIPTYKKIKDFLTNMPRLEYRIDYKNSFGNERHVVFRSIVDFFFFL